MLKIIGGTYRSRQLESPPEADGLRPYLGRIRESVFSLLRGWFDDANVLDLFAGVGSVSLEAASRGAARVLAVEQHRPTYEILRRNIATLGCGDRVTPMLGDALASTCLLRAPAPVTVTFVDPPYAMLRDEMTRERVLTQAAQCRAVMAPKSWLVLRTGTDPATIDFSIAGFDGPEVHDYSHQNWVLLYMPTQDPTSDERQEEA